MPYKGMKDGLEALLSFCRDGSRTHSRFTQESRGRAIFNGLPYPIRIRLSPTERALPEIIASCDIYCCTSWYEGLGLPALQSVLLRSSGRINPDLWGISMELTKYEDLLLARPNHPQDLYAKIKKLLGDRALGERLREAAFKTVAGGYDWDKCVAAFERILLTIRRTSADLKPFDPQLMRELCGKLEEAGNLTPIAIFQAL